MLSSRFIESISFQPVRSVLTVEGTMKGYEEGEKFTTNILTNDPAIMEEIRTVGKTKNPQIQIIKAPETSAWVSFLISIVPFVIIFVLFFFLMNQAQGGGGKVMNFGKSRARLYNEEKKRVPSRM